MAVLRISGQPELPLLTDRVALGRAPGCDVVIDAPSVAEHHATLVRTEFGWLIIDETDRAGVEVEGQPVHNHFLRSAQTFTLGGVAIDFDPDAGRAETSAPTIPGEGAPSSTPTVPGQSTTQTGATVVPGQTLVPDRSPRRFEPPPRRQTLLMGTPPGPATAGAPIPPPPPAADYDESSSSSEMIAADDDDGSSETLPGELDQGPTQTLSGGLDQGSAQTQAGALDPGSSDTLLAPSQRPPAPPPPAAVEPDVEPGAEPGVDRGAPTYIDANETPAPPPPASLEPEMHARPSSRYLLGDERAVGGGPVRLGTSQSGVYRLGEADPVPSADKPPVRFELGDAARRPPSVYELGVDNVVIPDDREFSVSGAAPPVRRRPDSGFSLGDTAPAPGRRSPRDDAYAMGGLPFAKTDPTGAGSSPSVYTMGDAVPQARVDEPSGPARLEPYALGPGPSRPAAELEPRVSTPRSSPSVYSLGPEAAPAVRPSSPSAYTLGSPGPPAAHAIGPTGPARPDDRGAPSPAESWSWVDADPRRRGTRASTGRGRGLVAVGFAFVLLGGILVGLSFLLGLRANQILGLIGGGG